VSVLTSQARQSVRKIGERGYRFGAPGYLSVGRFWPRAELVPRVLLLFSPFLLFFFYFLISFISFAF
jgi:hypothetical protein